MISQPATRVVRRFALAVILIGVAAWLAYRRIGAPLIGVDDANIFLAYARNLAAGRGIVFSAGDAPTEGISSLLWLVMCAAAFRVMSNPEVLILGVEVLLAAATLTAALELFDRLSSADGPLAREWASLCRLLMWGWVLLAPSYVTWSTISLMDVGIWSFALAIGLVAAIDAVESPRLSAGVHAFAALASLLLMVGRPEGFLWAVVFLGTIAGGRLLRGYGWSGLAPLCAVVGGWFVALMGFRLWYFGYPLPNTFYAKVSPDPLYDLGRGVTYLAKFVLSNPLNAPAILAAVIPAGLGIRTWLHGDRVRALSALPFAILTIWLFLGLAIPAAAGGDHFALFRFYQPLWPLFGLSLALGVARLLPRPARLLRPGITLGIGALTLWVLYCSSTPAWHSLSDADAIILEFKIANAGRAQGAALNGMFDDELFEGEKLPSVADVTIGGLGLTYRGTTVDLMGLTNVAMGHAPGDRKGIANHAAFNTDVFFSLNPEMLLPKLSASTSSPPASLDACGSDLYRTALRGLLCSDRFVRHYGGALLQRNGDRHDPRVFAFVRRDKLADLRRLGMVAAEFEPARP